MRKSLLGHDPEIESVGMPMLIGIARAIEGESMQRYASLASTMERRGEFATAAALRIMLDEERAHADAIERWASGLGEPLPRPASVTWQLPPDLFSSWDEIAGSALLTPYRVFAIAVDNEQRAFTMYSYLAARAADARVQREAERLAVEELRHAALMRRWRRQAWHRERRAKRGESSASDATITSADMLHALLQRHEAIVADLHRVLAARLHALGDDESAQLLMPTVQRPPRAPEAVAASPDAAALDACSDDDPARLLVAAQKPLEAFSEALEAVMRNSEGALFEQAQTALTNVVARLARVALQAARRMQPA